MAKSAKKPAQRKAIKKTARKSSVKKAKPAVKRVVKKAPPKKAASKKSVSKKPVAKKAKPAIKRVAKKAPAKKVKQKKVFAKKKAAVSRPSKKVIVKKQEVKTPKIRIEKIKTPVNMDNENMTDTATWNEQTAMANDSTELTEGNDSMVSEIIPFDEDELAEMDATISSIPAPAEKYGRPADPYHGNTTPVKGKRSAVPSSKKPLWNKS